jgi:hypothetical protein
MLQLHWSSSQSRLRGRKFVNRRFLTAVITSGCTEKADGLSRSGAEEVVGSLPLLRRNCRPETLPDVHEIGIQMAPSSTTTIPSSKSASSVRLLTSNALNGAQLPTCALTASPTPVIGPTLFDSFCACRTTLDDLKIRMGVLGKRLTIATIAGHLTGRSDLSDQDHNALVDAINIRLRELSAPPTARYRR